jgi:integrase/recombinase XerC
MMPWGRFRSEYRQSLVGLGYSQETVRTYADAVAWLATWAGERELEPAEVTAAHLLAFMGSRSHWSRATRGMVRAAVRSAYRWAVVAGVVATSPAETLPPARRKPPAPHPVPADVYESALRAAAPRERLMLRLAAEAGLRRAEVAQVHPRRDMVEEAGGWSLWAHGKGDKDRLVPLPADLARELRLAAGDGWLFPGKTDGHLAPHTVGRYVAALLPGDHTMHGLRHRFASDGWNATRDLFAVQQVLGHVSASTTQVYVLVDDEARRAVVDAVASKRTRPRSGKPLPGARGVRRRPG